MDPEAQVGYMPPNIRAHWHCGWMPEEDWAPWPPGERGLPPAIGPELYKQDVCPGWLVRQPAVVEIAEAHTAFTKGALASYHPDPDNLVLDGVQEMEASMNRFQLHRMKEKTEQ